ncbi:MAG: S-methyl-5-thioribose-1-phosphate isomerase [Candidatus Eisenbacteria sp.]|nr:S-methyl-5-thioribose-1-phosphate isomerase [Candidatus Eisenbacteria bacterium]
MIATIAWTGSAIRILDQTRLPEAEIYLDLDDLDGLCEAILNLRIRGAPAIGIAGIYGVALMALHAAEGSWQGAAADPERRFLQSAQRIREIRPTAVNLAWAVDRAVDCFTAARSRGASLKDAAAAVLTAARELHAADLDASRAMGKAGAVLLKQGSRVLTHCNTGGLATGGLGTALAVVFEAARRGKAPCVYVAETRPLLQGARLTAWELLREGIEATVVVDGARAWLMANEGLDLVLVGADRIAANGDTANKIGTLGGAVAAARYGVDFYVVAPFSTFDLNLPSGAEIPVEQRSADEVRCLGGKYVTPKTAPVWNPAFDVTPAELIKGWITEHGILQPPFDGGLRQL